MRTSGLIMAAFLATPIFGCAMEPEYEGQEALELSSGDETETASMILDDGSQERVLHTSEDEVAGDTAARDTVEADLITSFTASCPGWWYVTANGAAVEAGASYCRSYTGRRYNPHWSGWCVGNLANIDGYIVC